MGDRVRSRRPSNGFEGLKVDTFMHDKQARVSHNLLWNLKIKKRETWVDSSSVAKLKDLSLFSCQKFNTACYGRGHGLWQMMKVRNHHNTLHQGGKLRIMRDTAWTKQVLTWLEQVGRWDRNDLFLFTLALELGIRSSFSQTVILRWKRTEQQ